MESADEKFITWKFLTRASKPLHGQERCRTHSLSKCAGGVDLAEDEQVDPFFHIIFGLMILQSNHIRQFS